MRNCYYDKPSNSIADLILGIENPLPMLDVNSALITRINVPDRYRGNGIGSKLLQQILKDADQEGITLYLEILASGGLTYIQLDAWYRRHGFIWDEEQSLMFRKPKK